MKNEGFNKPPIYALYNPYRNEGNVGSHGIHTCIMLKVVISNILILSP